MILPDFIIQSKQNLQTDYESPDSPASCLDKEWFDNYPYNVSYIYNSRGYRDQEWNDDLQNSIWCVGDSFTVGIGSPIEHTWPYLLAKETNKSVINVSVNGASNDWISRKAEKIVEVIKPKNLIILWSYFYRRESSDTSLSDLDRQLPSKSRDYIWQTHYKNFKQNRDKILSNFPNLIDACIPNCWTGSKLFAGNDMLKFVIEDKSFIGELPILDYARDYHHFDFKTSKYFVDNILKFMEK
jgi:hypothetical protein